MKEQQSFSFRIFDGRGEWLENYRKIVNKIFVHKRFEAPDNSEYPYLTCTPYYENLLVRIEYRTEGDGEEAVMRIHRVALSLLHPEEKLQRIHSLFQRSFRQNDFEHFKVYWDYYKSDLTIYAERRKYPRWNTLDFEQSVSKFRQGVDLMVDFIKEVEKKVR